MRFSREILKAMEEEIKGHKFVDSLDYRIFIDSLRIFYNPKEF